MKDFKPKNGGATLKYIELFAGIGGFRYGLDQLGAECVMASEICREARETYTANFGKNEPLLGDINAIDEHDVPDHDLLTGGFPCQSYSEAGQERGLLDETGRLFFEIMRIVKFKKPKAILLENVPNLLLVDDGEPWKMI